MPYRKLPLTDADAQTLWEAFDALYADLLPTDNDREEQRLVLKTENDEGAIIAGCVFDIDALKNAEFERLWVDERYRRRGLATALILKAEMAARDRGCRTITNAYCFDFQAARPLFEKLGYTLIGIAPDWPKGHKGYTFIKLLDDAVPLCEKHETSSQNAPAVLLGSEAEGSFITDKLEEYNSAFAPRSHPYFDLDLKLADENGGMIAGVIAGVSGWDTLHVDMLWVSDELRGRGVGSHLLSEIEREAKSKGAYLARLDAINTAAGYFINRGYEVITAYEVEPKWSALQKRL